MPLQNLNLEKCQQDAHAESRLLGYVSHAQLWQQEGIIDRLSSK